MDKHEFNNPFTGLHKKVTPRDEKKDPDLVRHKTEKSQPRTCADENEDARLFATAMSNVSAQDIKRHGKARELPRQSAASAEFDPAGATDGSFGELLKKDDKKPASGKTKSAPEKNAPKNAVGQYPKGSMERAFMESPEAALPVEETDVFSKAMLGVQPLSTRGRDLPKTTRLKEMAAHGPLPDPNTLLTDFVNGKLEFALEFTDEYVQGHVVGLDPLVLGKLKAGQYSPEANLDLHGLNTAQAYNSLIWFLRDAYQRGMRTVVVVTGRGRNSPDGKGVLRERIQDWLTRDPMKRVVLAFCTAQPCDGGAGALYVALRKYKKSHGKIHWERTPTDEELL